MEGEVVRSRLSSQGAVVEVFAWTGLFLGAFGLLLLVLVDASRGVLLPLSEYVRVGAPSAFLYLSPVQGLLVLPAVAGLWGAYRGLQRSERRLIMVMRSELLGPLRLVLVSGIMILLIIDLFTYRSVQAERLATAGRVGLSRAFDFALLPPVLWPLAEAVNLLLLSWHSISLGIVIGAVLLVLLQASQQVRRVLCSDGLSAHLVGSLSAIAYPFCSCCAGPMGASLYRGGASLGASLAFVVAAPLLNVTSFFLAFLLLPPEYFALRLLSGVGLAVFGTWLVVRVAGRDALRHVVTGARRLTVLERLTTAFAFEREFSGRSLETPVQIIQAWVRASWIIARVAIPVFLVSATAIGWVTPILLSLGGHNSFWLVLVATTFGVLFVSPTWTEIAFALPLIERGLTGAAAALLVALPATSLPSLVDFGAALRDWRVPVALVAIVSAVSVLAGLLFL